MVRRVVKKGAGCKGTDETESKRKSEKEKGDI